MRNVAIILLLAIAVYGSGQTIAVTECDDPACQTGCSTQNLDQDTCYTNKDLYASFRCQKGAAVCVHAQTYSDSACTQLTATLNTVCNSCQLGYQLICGGLKDAVFWSQNCTDLKCQSCGGAAVVPVGKCTLVGQYGYVQVHEIKDCVGVQWHNYSDDTATTPCNGTENSIIFEDGRCLGGMRLSCLRPVDRFTQIKCPDSTCKKNCTSQRFATKKCLPTSSGASAIVECLSDTVQIQLYTQSTNCTGNYIVNVEPTDKCMLDQSGLHYFENFCTGHSVSSKEEPAVETIEPLLFSKQ